MEIGTPIALSSSDVLGNDVNFQTLQFSPIYAAYVYVSPQTVEEIVSECLKIIDDTSLKTAASTISLITAFANTTEKAFVPFVSQLFETMVNLLLMLPISHRL
jgi:hypothetical protein